MLIITPRIRVPLSEIEFTYARSPGPGGQNVNKVNSKAVLRWAVARSPGLPDDVRQRFLARYRRRITGDGELVIAGQRFRDQEKNRADCLDRLREMLQAVATPPKVRRPTKPTRSSQRRRLEAKRQHSQKKRGRADGSE